MARLEGVKVFDAKEGSIEKLRYEGDIYVKTKDLPKKGDIALVNVAWGNQIEGGYYLVNNEDNDMYEFAKSDGVEKDYVFIEGEMGDANTEPHKVEIFRKHIVAKEGDLIENKTKGKRGHTTNDFKKGMRVKLDVAGSPEYGWGDVSNGDLGVVAQVQSEKLFVNFENQSMWTALPTELIILDENTKEAEYKVGDLVEIIEEGSHEFEIGEVVRLNKVDDPVGQPYRAERINGGNVLSPWLYEHEFKRFDGISGEEVISLYETPKETPTYKIGDIVVVTVERVLLR